MTAPVSRGRIAADEGHNNEERRSGGSVVFGAILFALCVAAGVAWTDPWSSTAVVVIFGWAVWAFYRSEPLFLYLALPFVFHWSWCLVSIRYLESGAYISEQFRYGTLTGASPRFALLALAFLIVVMVGCRGIVRSKRLAESAKSANRSEVIAKFGRRVPLFTWALVAALIATGLVYGFPLLTGQSRFEYWPQTPGLQRLGYLVPVAALGLGIAHNQIGGRKAVVPLAASIATLVLFSDKFSGPLAAVIYFSVGYYAARALDPASPKRHIGLGRIALVVPLVGGLLAVTTAYGYMAVDGKESHEIRQVIVNRALGLQGHVYYGIDQRVLEGSDTIEPTDFLRVNREPMEPGGLVRLMYEVSPPGFVTAMRTAGIRFTNGYPAIAVASFGFLGALVVQLLMGLGYVLFAFYLAMKIVRLELAGIALAGMYLSNIITNALIMGEMYYFYRPMGLLLLSAMLVQQLLSTASAARQRRVERQQLPTSPTPNRGASVA